MEKPLIPTGHEYCPRVCAGGGIRMLAQPSWSLQLSVACLTSCALSFLTCLPGFSRNESQSLTREGR